MSSSTGGSEKMGDQSDSLGYKVDRNLPVGMSRPTGSYASVGNEEGTTIMRTHCNPTEFCSVVSNLSPAKIRAVNEMGFGYLQELKMEFMHDHIWMSMVNGVDLKNSSVVICGVQYSLTAGQFTRCTGITDGIFDVVIRPEPFQVGNGYMGSYLFDNDGKLERSNLVDVIRNREEADDLFKIMYTLYAVNTIICPGTDSEFIDTSIMNSITRATRIRDLNWASYAITVLIDGVQKHRRGETQVVAGCMLFMELLYLDILGEAMDRVDKTLVPVSAWRTEDADEVVRQVKLNGGFGSPLVMVKQRERLKTLSEFVNNDGTVGIGINRAVHEDIYELKAKVCSTHRRIGGIVNLLEEFLANFYDTRDLLVNIEKKIARDEEDNRVKEVWTGPDCKFNARKRGSYSAAGHNEYPKRTCSGQPSLLAGNNKPHCARRLSMDGKKNPRTPSPDTDAVSETSSSPGAFPGRLRYNCGSKGLGKKLAIPRSHVRILHNKAMIEARLPTESHKFQLPDGAGPKTDAHPPISSPPRNNFMAGPYELRRPVPPTDVRLINYVFMGGKQTSTTEDNTRMGECGHGREILHRNTIRCLAPRTDVDSDVINYVSEFLSRDNPRSWFFSSYFTHFSNNAKSQTDGKEDEEEANRTRSVCNMFRFDGRLDTCDLIFVPIHMGRPGTKGGHWWLLVIDTRRQVAEIWDSAPRTSIESQRMRIAYNVLSHLQQTVHGLGRGQDFRRYRILTPPNVPIQPNGFDCGIFVILHMMFYGIIWWIDFHSDEHRSAILLQCMKSPANEIHDEVREDADNYHFGRSSTFLQPGPAAPAAPAAAEGRDDDLLLNVCLQQPSETNFTSINHVECHNLSDWLDDFSSST